jgi:magnesium-transporting ATPase (P-type)
MRRAVLGTEVSGVPPGTGVGLTSRQAAVLLGRHGPNHLPLQRPQPIWRRLGAELVHFFALLFWVAGALAFVAGMPQLGIAIFAVIVLNGVFAFAQEERAQHAAEGLRRMLPRRATVLRDGMRQEIAADDIVPGDLVLLSEGDRITADGVTETVTGLAVDTSALTGESVAEFPGVGDGVFAGCFAVQGEASVRVTRTGAQTRLAAIARLTQGQRHPPTPLRRELTRVSRVIAVVAMIVGGSFFGLAVLIGMPPSDGFLFAIGVTVAVVPEGLLPTVTLSLAIGAQRMAGKHALVRHLEAVETLGSTTFICTDKTGTLTQNEMAVIAAWTPRGSATICGVGYAPTAEAVYDPPAAAEAVRGLAWAAMRCSTGRVELAGGVWVARGDPMEAALDAFARRVGAQPPAEGTETDRARFPFDAHRRRMSVIAGNQILVKGAPDAVLPLCADISEGLAALEILARRGLRVLAVASRDLAVADSPPASATEAEHDLRLLGLIGLEDPPRPAVAGALDACRRAGIRVAMVTGDHPETAAAIAAEVGLQRAAGVVVRGADLPDDDDALGELLDRDELVVARVTPEDKLRIARALRLRGHVVAMTGDGVNDAPALREAAIGVAMGKSGTDVAREAADVVLLDDNFATIVAAVKQGRSTFANIRRFLTYHLADNVAELAPFVVWALSGGRFPLAIGVLQVLALDIGTDVFPALALGAEPPKRRVLDGPPVRGHLLDRAMLIRAFAVLGLTEATVALAAFVASCYAAGWRPGQEFPSGAALFAASGAAFTAIVLGQAANAFACRSETLPAWAMSPRSNRLLIGAVAVELALLVVLLYVPPIARVLGHAGPTAAGFAMAAVAVPAVVLVDAVYKRLRRVGDHRPYGMRHH